MRSWLIIVAGAVAATAASIFAFAPDGPLSGNVLAEVLLADWPMIAVAWLGIYAIAVLILSTVSSLDERRDPGSPPLGNDCARRYAMRLVVSQYFTAVAALLVMGLARFPVETGTHSPPLLPAITASPGLVALGATIFCGLIGWLIISATMLRLPLVAPVARHNLELQLLQEIADSVRGHPPVVTAEFEQLSGLIERSQRSVLQTLNEVAAAVNQLGRGMHEELVPIMNAVSKPPPSYPPEALNAMRTGMESAATQVHAALGLLDASVGRLAEIAAFMAANDTPSAVRGDPGDRSRLSTELQQLLRELAPGRNDRLG